MEKATFAVGCFWCIQPIFKSLKGVISTVVGYTGGTVENPTYEEVCSHSTGHAEAIEITFNPEEITYSALLKIFWEIHDPTTKDRQGVDIGSQYRSAIFYHNDKQKNLAEDYKEALNKSDKYKDKIVTEIEAASVFYPAEDYHQNYNEKKAQYY